MVGGGPAVVRVVQAFARAQVGFDVAPDRLRPSALADADLVARQTLQPAVLHSRDSIEPRPPTAGPVPELLTGHCVLRDLLEGVARGLAPVHVVASALLVAFRPTPLERHGIPPRGSLQVPWRVGTPNGHDIDLPPLAGHV